MSCSSRASCVRRYQNEQNMDDIKKIFLLIFFLGELRSLPCSLSTFSLRFSLFSSHSLFFHPFLPSPFFSFPRLLLVKPRDPYGGQDQSRSKSMPPITRVSAVPPKVTGAGLSESNTGCEWAGSLYKPSNGVTRRAHRKKGYFNNPDKDVARLRKFFPKTILRVPLMTSCLSAEIESVGDHV